MLHGHGVAGLGQPSVSGSQMASEKKNWGHDHDLPSQASHSHGRPATRPKQRPLMQIHLQSVAKLWVLAIFVGQIKPGIGTPTA